VKGEGARISLRSMDAVEGAGGRDAPAWSVPLPADAEEVTGVYVNGEPRTEGVDFTVDGRWLRFRSRLVARPPLGFGRRVMLFVGIGVYGDLKGDVVDVQYRSGGSTRLASNLPVIPPQPPDPAGSG
jgi:hypothetical protein